MIDEAIRNFAEQFSYEPEIQNGVKLGRYDRYVICGMGGSHLAADLLRVWNPYIRLTVHKDYGLPALSRDDFEKSLLIFDSYSGNTAEVLDGFREALRRGYAMAVLATGGELLEEAKKEKVPYVELPDEHLQPRLGLGYVTRALLHLLHEEDAFQELGKLTAILKPEEYEEMGKCLAEQLKGFVPIIYSSRVNGAIAYNWKIKFNETGKTPAFFNVFPELNHNEMTGFDVKEATKELSSKFYFVFLKDKNDDPRILKRMELTERLFKDRGLRVQVLDIAGVNPFHKIFSSLIFSDWVSYYLAKEYGFDPEVIPMVEEFKKNT
ncbi:MAG: hypothetical protein A3H06_01400 [Candidatus Colwellbacteria bacterium RIFCSPLOWO2_12_FULL_44_13]|uniref:SIS domain-containing protein n=1 Tax=Candidatus Colwellbacteria bacterium RIFCSPLOWO2_12_FULL_44_13 TaxID=1797694 RepID=A0A1G1ZBT7_9BACT|nr:MAG: hypothetical protein A3H06_01400 [Candidatus Colwellbacteria bacterium RIFCSPLOWO2_12_FULL_44_13]